MAKRDHAKDQDLDPAGAHGGDTGKTSFAGDGPQAEEGNRRRDTPVYSGPTHCDAQGMRGEYGKRPAPSIPPGTGRGGKGEGRGSPRPAKGNGDRARPRVR
jgi:hypothetical protein